MNENLDLTKILAGCPIGTPLYSTIHGDVTFDGIEEDCKCPIYVEFVDEDDEKRPASYTIDGRYFAINGAECVLFPSRDCRDWSQFKRTHRQFKPFDKVIVCDGVDDNWMCSLYSNCIIGNDRFQHNTLTGCFVHCLPFEGNEHLVGQQFKEEHIK